MFRYRFLRNSFFFTLLLVIMLPLYVILIVHPTFQGLLTEFTEENAVNVANFMAEAVQEQPGKTGTLLVNDSLKSHMAETAQTFHLYKYRLFDAQGRIIHSSAPSEIGNLNQHAYFHEVVAKGKPYSLTVEKNHKTLENDLLKLDVVETYVPILRNTIFLGAFEIYFDITEWRRKLNSGVSHASLILGILAATFFLVILSTRFYVMRRVGMFMAAIKETSQGDFHRRIPLSGKDELTDMANAFNL
ncbi:MAG: HAMP domain-containing protein, partial [Magnetococcales bacterium]|nr:HAMP domain-containing protein [Magnetococcales bacterium]